MWTQQESLDARERARQADPEEAGPLSDAATCAIMDYAAERLAARGGTMTAGEQGELDTALAYVRPETRQKIAAQGAGLAAARAALEASTTLYDERCAEVATLREKVAGLEADLANKAAAYAELESDASQVREEMDVARAELARLRPSGQVAEDERIVQECIPAAPVHERDTAIAALSRLAALAQQGQALKEDRRPQTADRLREELRKEQEAHAETRKEVQRRDSALATHARLAEGCYQQAIRLERERAEKAEAQIAHIRERVQRMSRGADKDELMWRTRGPWSVNPLTSSESLPWPGPRAHTPGASPRAQPLPLSRCTAGSCGHTDAAEPGHAERVEKASAAFKEAAAMHPNGHCTCAGEGICAWCDQASRSENYDAGAEDMRAACIKAVRTRLEVMGALDVYEAVKNAIEGAAP
jgi:hypothetical protein